MHLRLSPYKVVSATVAVLGIFAVVYNAVRVDGNPPAHTIAGIIAGGVGVGWFGAGLWFDRGWLRMGQIFLCLVVSYLAVVLNATPWLGLFFLFASICIAYRYGFFRQWPLLKLSLLILITYLVLLYIYKDTSKSLFTLLAFLATSGFLWYILQSDNQALVELSLKANDLLDEAAEKLRKADKDG